MMNQRETILQRSHSARPAFHSRGTSAMAQCRFILTVGRHLMVQIQGQLPLYSGIYRCGQEIAFELI